MIPVKKFEDKSTRHLCPKVPISHLQICRNLIDIRDISVKWCCMLISILLLFYHTRAGFPGIANGKNSLSIAGNSRDKGSIPGLERSPEIGNGNLLQYPCLKHSMNRGAWWATVHGVAKSLTRRAVLNLLKLSLSFFQFFFPISVKYLLNGILEPCYMLGTWLWEKQIWLLPSLSGWLLGDLLGYAL